MNGRHAVLPGADTHGFANRPDGRRPGTVVACTMGDLLAYFLRLGALGFGGPIALAGYMQRDLVERRRWIAREDYVEGLALAQLSPGKKVPEALLSPDPTIV
jgi:hypothetical protein